MQVQSVLAKGKIMADSAEKVLEESFDERGIFVIGTFAAISEPKNGYVNIYIRIDDLWQPVRFNVKADSLTAKAFRTLTPGKIVQVQVARPRPAISKNGVAYDAGFFPVDVQVAE